MKREKIFFEAKPFSIFNVKFMNFDTFKITQNSCNIVSYSTVNLIVQYSLHTSDKSMVSCNWLQVNQMS